MTLVSVTAASQTAADAQMWALARSLPLNPVSRWGVAPGYGDTLGEDALWDGFEEYCRQRDTTPAQVPFTDQAVGDFLEWLLSAQAGSWDAGGPQKQRDDEGAGYDSPDYSYSGSGSDDDDGGGQGGGRRAVVKVEGDSEAEEGDQDMTDGDSGGCWLAHGCLATCRPASCHVPQMGICGLHPSFPQTQPASCAAAAEDGALDVMNTDEEAEGPSDAEVEAIEESSEDEALAAARRPPRSARRGAGSAQGGPGRGPPIDTFFQRLPPGVPSSLALAAPPPSERQLAGAQASRPATVEEQQLDLLDYANLMVGAGRSGLFT
jgi:hypothetical protein